MEIDDFPDMPMRRCKVCGDDKKLMFFNLSNRSADGKTGTCRVCLADENQRRAVGNPVPASSLGGWDARLRQRNKRRIVRSK